MVDVTVRTTVEKTPLHNGRADPRPVPQTRQGAIKWRFQGEQAALVLPVL